MINSETLNRCIDILSELNANASSKKDKSLILELGYIIKQELDLIKEWESNNRKQALMRGVIDVNKLLEDNTQLYNENEKLLASLNKLKKIVETKIPAIQEETAEIGKKFDILTNCFENGF